MCVCVRACEFVLECVLSIINECADNHNKKEYINAINSWHT